MSEREQVLQIIDAMPEYKITGLLTFLRTFEDIPNEETIAAMEEVDKMIENGTGQHFDGSTEDLFKMLLEE